MQTETFQKEITFISKVFNAGTSEFELNPVTKIATFKELSRTSKEQHKLHFQIMTLFNGKPVDEFSDAVQKISVDYDATYDITTHFIKRMLVIEGTDISAAEKEEILNDSGAILPFGLWLIAEKIVPFFRILIPN